MPDRWDAEAMDAMTSAARWTPDCQGKQDYDGPLLDISTRYWPRGGGLDVLTAHGWEGNEARPDILPAAHAAILLRHGNPEDEEYSTIVAATFEGETEVEVKVQVETWVQARFQEIVRLLGDFYGLPHA